MGIICQFAIDLWVYVVFSVCYVIVHFIYMFDHSWPLAKANKGTKLELPKIGSFEICKNWNYQICITKLEISLFKNFQQVYSYLL